MAEALEEGRSVLCSGGESTPGEFRELVFSRGEVYKEPLGKL